MLTYLLQMIACSGVLYSYYHFFLRNEKFHQYNRFYLLAAIAISILLPLFKIPVELNAADTASPIYTFVSTGENITVSASSGFNYYNLLYIFYGLVVVFFFVQLIVSVRKILAIKNKSTVENIEDITFIKTAHPDSPFSFFKWLFWNKTIALDTEKGQHIFKHEVYHIRSKHSLDLLFIEIVMAILWFNPFLYLYRKEIKTIQEFLADKYASHESDANEYAQLLLVQAIANRKQKLINPFFHNQLKRRIAMLTSSKKPQYQQARKLLTLPVFLILATFIMIRCKPADEKTERSATNNDTAATTAVPGKKVQTLPDTALSTSTQDQINTTENKEPVYKNKKGEIIPGPAVFTKVDVDAKFPGNWVSFLTKNLNAQVPSDNGAPTGTYTTITQFVVDVTGNVSDVKAMTNVGYGMEAEAVRAIKKSGKWLPAVQNGREVKAYRKQPITFQIQEQ